MAINSFEKTCDKIESMYSSNNPRVNMAPGHLLKLNTLADDSLSSNDGKSNKTKKMKNAKSPYLTGDNVLRLSRVTEKKMVTKKATNIQSSFPLAVNIYKANSDEFKSLKKCTKKVKKSVLTLPNVPATLPQTCTVSDMNDSEYNTSDDNKKVRTKKRFLAQNKKPRPRDKDYEFYDRDARFCSQMNINLDCSSNEIINQFTGDGKCVTNKYRSTNRSQADKEFSAHDVWAVLRNINRFQFRPSPPMSDDSIQIPKKIKIRNRRRNNRKNTRITETTHTKEFAFISSFGVDHHSPSPTSFSKSSSFDRITVIDKQDELNDLCKDFEISFEKCDEFTNHPITCNRNSITKHKKNYAAANTLHKNQNKTVSGNIENVSRLKGPCNDNQSISNNKVAVIIPQNNRNNVYKQEHIHLCNGITEQSEEFNTATVNELRFEPSKVTISSSCKKNKGNDNEHNVPSNESGQQIKGITKVILSKGQEIALAKRNDKLKRKLSTMTSASLLPKLTQADIRRRLANIKFPIVILEKDQLGTTSIQVTNYEPPQFEGLSQKIWPFMQDWYDNNISKQEKLAKPSGKQEDSNIPTKNRFNFPIQRKVNSRKINGEESKPRTKEKLIPNNESMVYKNKYYKQPLPPREICKVGLQPLTKPKPVHQLRDKMLKLLYKNVSVKNLDEQSKTRSHDAQCDTSDEFKITVEVIPPNKVKEIELNTETDLVYDVITSEFPKTLSMKAAPETKNVLSVTRHSWAKGNWASEFIENVIRKIRNGVYYTHENSSVHKSLPIDAKEVSIQTELTEKDIQVNEELVEKKHFEFPENYFDVLPGFDERPPALEIKSLNMKEISIRHCTTNVLVQFDVAQPAELEHFNPIITSSSFIPLAITESHTRIFKYKTTIINAVLPAELCSILPNLLKTIADSNRLPSLPTITSYQNDSNLYTISELSRSESPDLFKYKIPTAIALSPNSKKLLNGSYKRSSRKCNKINKCQINIRYCNMKEVFPILQSTQKLFALKIQPVDFICSKPNAIQNPVQLVNENMAICSCTALQLYNPNRYIFERTENSTFNKICTFTNLLKQIWDQGISIRFKMSMPLGDNNNINVLMERDETDRIGATTISVSKLKVDSLFNGFLNKRKKSNVITGSTLKAIEYKKNFNEEKADRKEVQGILSNTKTRKRGFVKLYKKCKSTSNIGGVRCSTSISKIINLDDFFQALGSGKMLSSVFDGQAGKKILASVSEMKSWITDINQRQAMLVLLLTNKKDTPNLVRFRPVLLQGIAVNRITRASELDMEIEVIERENFNRFSQYEGIPYSPEIVENSNNLLEELFWIAKTTASDYQKPFNETTEKLLKSLLEKRKKLNPSYLRVMARYVGLGLLKLPRHN